MAKKTAEPPQRDIEFGLSWETHPTHQMPPTLLRTLQRRAHCARYNIRSKGPNGVSVTEHRREIIRTIWPENIHAWHSWSERRLKSVSEHHFVMWMGPGGCGKTADAAAIALEWWLEDPTESAVIVCSTTKDMLRTRIWGDIVRLHSILPAEVKVGELLDTACFVRIRDGDWKHGIKGIAVQDGPEEEAINNIIGMHASRVFVILDEAQGVREAIMKAIPNLLANPESRMLIMGNPNSFMSLLCRYGAPIDGWDSIPKFTEEWECKSHGYDGKGVGLFFDGRKSPAVVDPEWGAKHPWMVNKKQIDKFLLERCGGNENDPEYMTQKVGWPPSMGVETTILDGSILLTFRCQKPPVWTHGKTGCAALDPAFNGGDKAVLTFGYRGWVEDEDGKRWQLGFTEQLIIPVDSEAERPVHYQLMDFCRKECESRGIPANELAIAAAGEGGGLISICRQEWGPVVAIEEGGAPSERIVGAMGKEAKTTYDTRASELAFGLREFALGNGIRGLPDEAADQACKRLTFNKRGKWCCESKSVSKGQLDDSGKPLKGFKTRLGKSPDEFDSCIIFVEHCRLKGAEPGVGAAAPRAVGSDFKKARETDAMYSESNYTQEEDWQGYASAL